MPDEPEVVIPWEGMKEKLIRLHSLRTSHEIVVVKRERAHKRLSSYFQKESEQIVQYEVFESLRLRIEEMKNELKSSQSSLEKQKRKMACCYSSIQTRIQYTEVALHSLAAAAVRLQDANGLLEGPSGMGQLDKLQQALGWRRQRMTNQIATIYDISPPQSRSNASKPQEKSTQSSTSSSSSPLPSIYAHFSDPCSRTEEGAKPKPATSFESLPEKHMLEIAKLPLPSVAIKIDEISDKNYLQTLSSSLGLAAHAAALISRYLDVPLRYPVEYFASKSYIWDVNPPSEIAFQSQTIEAPSHVFKHKPPLKGIRFPLFTEGQDGSRFSYAIFLLNKNLEQLLSGLGFNWVGPRHTLPNLERLYSIVREGFSNPTN